MYFAAIFCLRCGIVVSLKFVQKEVLKVAHTLRALDFDEIANRMLELGMMESPAYLHATMVGKIAAGQRFTDEQWLDELDALLEPEEVFSSEDEVFFNFIHAHILSSIKDQEFGFYPLLPSDDEALEQRLQSLSQWCENFMVGFALVGKEIEELPDIVNEALHHLAAISQVDSQEESFDDSAEEDFAQLVEYVRLAAMNIYYEYAEPETTDTKQSETMSAQSLFQQRQLH